jgi:hypothetical protein
MNRLTTLARRLLRSSSLALTLTAALPLAAQAAQTSYFVPFGGAGNLSVFDATAGTGGWVGSIDQVAPPVVSDPLSLVSFVLFTLDASTLALTGHFEFTTTDLQSSLFGEVSGSADSADFLSLGGQLSLDYSIKGGSGDFADASGFGLAFLTYDPAGTFNTYSEDGLLAFTVPEPGSLALAGLGLLAVLVSRRKVAWAFTPLMA